MFYETEIELRKQLKYPPFCDIILIGFSSTNETEIKQISNALYEYLNRHLEDSKYKVFK